MVRLALEASKKPANFPETDPGAGVLPVDNLPNSKVIDHTWEGDNTNDREIDLSDDYDLIFVFLEESKANNVSHLAIAWAFGTVYGIISNDGASVQTWAMSMAAGNNYWQGKMTGADVNKVKLGADGTSDYGTNESGWTYRLIGFKLTEME